MRAGLAYEWMIDLSNRTGKDLWVCMPHMTDSMYWTSLAQLIYNNLDPSLKVYIEYSNETWNGSFSQFEYTLEEGQNLGLPGSNQWYQGGAYSVWQSINVFKAFEDVFDSESHRLVRVVAAMGNLDIARKALDNVLYASTWNPHGIMPDAFAIAPYIGSGLDGAAPDIATSFRAAIDSRTSLLNEGLGIANDHNLDYITYEGGQHITTNSHIWSVNPDIYDEYLYMLDLMEGYFSLYTHYTHAGNWQTGGAWGAKAYTGQLLSEAHKYRALVDYVASGGGPGGPGGTEVIIDNSDSRFVNNGFWTNQTWGSDFWGSAGPATPPPAAAHSQPRGKWISPAAMMSKCAPAAVTSRATNLFA